MSLELLFSLTSFTFKNCGSGGYPFSSGPLSVEVKQNFLMERRFCAWSCVWAIYKSLHGHLDRLLQGSQQCLVSFTLHAVYVYKVRGCLVYPSGRTNRHKSVHIQTAYHISKYTQVTSTCSQIDLQRGKSHNSPERLHSTGKNGVLNIEFNICCI